MIRCLVILQVFLLFSFPVLAQERADIRVSEQDGFTRLVIDVDRRNPYTLSGEDTRSTLVKFSEAITPSLSFDEGRRFDHIGGVRVVSRSPFELSFTKAADSEIRHFYVGSRLLIDVYPSASGQTPASLPRQDRSSAPQSIPTPELSPAPETAPEPATEPEPTPTSEPEPDVMPQPPRSDNADPQIRIVPITPVDREPIAPPPSEGSGNQITGDLMINQAALNISSAEALSSAAFIRDGKLWVAISPDALVTPQISGPGAEKLGELERFDDLLEDGMFYRVNSPANAIVAGLGDSILWRYVFSDRKSVV